MVVAALTFVLVVITGYYAFHTQRMAAEMVRNREQSASPHLVASIAFIGHGEAVVRITNVGQGAALDGRLEVVFIRPEGSDLPPHAITWTPNVVTPFERSDFYVPTGYRRVMADFAEQFPRVSLVGTVHDVLGKEHRVDDQLDVAGYWAQISKERTQLGYDPNELALRRVAAQLEVASRSLHDLVEVGRGTDFFVRMRREFGGTPGGHSSSPAPAEDPRSPSEDVADLPDQGSPRPTRRAPLDALRTRVTSAARQLGRRRP